MSEGWGRFGTGDGAQRRFELVKTYRSGGAATVRYGLGGDAASVDTGILDGTGSVIRIASIASAGVRRASRRRAVTLPP